VAQAWRNSVIRVLTLSFDVDKITVANERRIVMRFIYERLISKLNDPFRRTGLVLACTKDCDAEFEKELEDALAKHAQLAPQESEDALKATQKARADAEDVVAQQKKAQAEAAEALKKAGADRPARLAAMKSATKTLDAKAKELRKLKKHEGELKEASKKRKQEAASPVLWNHLKKEWDDARKSLARKKRAPFVNRDR